jgi:hypothetical protein
MNENLTAIGWEDVKDEFRKLNKELADIIDDLEPSKNLRLYRARYCFGSEYLKYGKLYLPGPGNELIPLTSPKVPKQIYDDLSYNLGSHPVSFILDKTIEIYMSFDYRETVVPFVQVSKGFLISTSGVLRSNLLSHHAPFLWNISAGARSIIMLPKISKAKNYQQLRRASGYRIRPPEGMVEHWSLFKTLHEHGLLGEWNLEIIFFSKGWFEQLDKPKFSRFKSYMQADLYNKFSYWSTQQFWNNYFSMLNNMAGIKPDSYVYDTVRHLLLLSMGVLPGMAPATNEESAPISAIQILFQNDYKLEKYLPIILELKLFNLYAHSEPVYYSLHYVNAHELSAKANEHASTIMELYECKWLLSYYLRKMQDNELNISQTVLSEIPTQVEFNFFHNDPTNYKEIRNSEEIFKNDLRFSQIIRSHSKAKLLSENPYSAPFVSGCVQIKKKSS